MKPKYLAFLMPFGGDSDGTTTSTAHHLTDTVSDCGSLGKYFYTNFHMIPGQIYINSTNLEKPWKF